MWLRRCLADMERAARSVCRLFTSSSTEVCTLCENEKKACKGTQEVNPESAAWAAASDQDAAAVSNFILMMKLETAVSGQGVGPLGVNLAVAMTTKATPIGKDKAP